MRRTRFLRNGSWLAILCAVVIFSAQSSRAEDDEFYPGLPDPEGFLGSSWGGAAQGGISYAKRAKQWFRSPDGMVTFTAGILDQGTEDLPNGDRMRKFGAFGEAFIVSPEGAPANYGYLPPMTVRSVGFGLMPVEATVQISQRRQNGYPIPLSTAMQGADYFEGGVGDPVRQDSYPTVVKDSLNVQLLAVRVDGVDLRLAGDCRTMTPAPFTMTGPAYTIPDHRGNGGNNQRDWYAAHDPSEYFHPNWGGQLTGTITIPPFTGCTTASGDDLSDLMTLSVSGPDNPVSARVGWPCTREVGGVGWPVAPGEATPNLVPETWKPTGRPPGGCTGTKKIPYPDRPNG